MNKRILVSLMIIGLVGAGLGGTTLAMFNDTETSQGNEFTAGELDLLVDWEESYNGEHVETQELTNDPGAIFELGDMKPGDHGEATVSLHLEDNPGWIWMNLEQTANWDNACTEPEREAEGQCGSEGELDEELEFVIWADDGDNVRQDDESVIFEGTAQELEEQSTSEGLLLDGNPSTDETEAFPGGETGYIGIKYEIPLETGNHIQGDSLKYDLSFYTEQRRHNDDPDNPWDSENDTEEPETPVNETPENEFYQVDFVEGEPQEDLSEATYTSEDRMQRYAHGGPDNPVDNETESDQVFSASGGEDCVDSNPFTTDLDEDTISVEFDVHNASSCEDIELSLVSYEKPYPGWIADRADEQEIFDSETETFNPGSHDMTVDIPDVNDEETEEPVEPSGNLTFNDQMVNEDGEVVINNVSTTVDSTVYVTYEDGNDTVIAGIRNAPADLNNFDPYAVEINESGVPGEYTARMMEKPIAVGYNPGDVLQESTLEKQYFSQSAQISAAAEQESEYTATQGDETTEITPIQGDEPVEELYDFRLPDQYDHENQAQNGATYGSGPTYQSVGTEDLQQQETSIMFLYEGPDGLSLVTVHDMAGGDGGSATFNITGLESGEWVVKDDLYLDPDGTKASSNYDNWNVDSDPQSIDWTWGGGGTDGGAYNALAEDFSFTIDPAFNEDAPLYDEYYTGDIDEWQVLSGDRDNPDRTTLDMDEEVTVQAE